MTINRGLWVPINTGNVGTTEVEARLADNALFESNNGADARSGLLNPQTSIIVTGKANMSYDIAACNPVINRASGEGVYRFAATGVTNATTTAAPGANSRIDVIWVKQNDQSKGDANNLAVAGVTQGVVAASPVAPAIPAGALELARATVGPNITATTSASITQTFRYAALKGTPIPVRNVTERAEITAPRGGQQVDRLDVPGQVDTYQAATSVWAPAGVKPFGHMGRTGGFQAMAGSGNIVIMDAAQDLAGGVTFDNANDSLVVPADGRYRITIKAMATGSSNTSAWAKCQVNNIDMSGSYVSAWKADAADYHFSHTVTKRLVAGDKVNLINGNGNSAVSTWGTDGYNGTYLEVEYVSA